MSHTDRPAIAVVGAGPSGLFACQALLRAEPPIGRIDVYDRLPTPYGLLRYGVAPDHVGIKSVASRLATVFEDPRVRYLGVVEFGRGVLRAGLLASYDAVIYAVGTAEDRRLGIPGECMPGSWPARSFVEWYSGHPDAKGASLADVRTAITLGVGNVAVDVARILLHYEVALAATDMPAAVLAELRDSPVEHVWLIGRRGPESASFSTTELRELLTLDGVAVHLDAAAIPDPASVPLVAGRPDRRVVANLQALRDAATREVPNPRAYLHLAFWLRPVELCGDERVESLVLEVTTSDAAGAVVGTGELVELPTDLVLSAVGYRGKPLPDVPFDSVRGTIPNVEGRVVDADGARQPHEYAVGWIKRGPVGVIGTNKSDAAETVEHLLADIADPAHAPDLGRPLADIGPVLAARGVEASSFDDWRRIEAAEFDLGRSQGRDASKIETWDALTAVLARRPGAARGPSESGSGTVGGSG